MTLLLDSTQLLLEVPESQRELAWHKSDRSATSSSRWQTYLNQLTVDTIIPMIKEEEDLNAKIWEQKKLNNIWEFVNGSAIVLGDTKLILIPSEVSDLEELRVPQEWIDIPEFVGDYYLAVEVNVDEGYLRIGGYTTHEKIKTQGSYDSTERYYTVDSDLIINDINALWVALDLGIDEVTQEEVNSISLISPEQANNLIDRLANSDNLVPRSSVPFHFWANILQNEKWLNKLAEKRRGIQQFSISDWLQNLDTNFLSQFGWQQIKFQAASAGSRDVNTTINPQVVLSKRLVIAEGNYELKITSVDRQENSWRFELSSLEIGGTIPANFQLKLLTEDGENFPENEDIALTNTDKLSLEFAFESGEGVIVEISPNPENYQQQVLKF